MKPKRREIDGWFKSQWAKILSRFEKEGDDRSLLSPTIIDKSDLSYACVKELEYAMSHEECKNIAVTGVYGSGKSSVIASYLNSRFRKRHLLQISLSNFIEKQIEEKPEKTNEYEEGVEYKIFQHILLKSNEHATRQSGFRRIRYVSRCRATWMAILTVSAVLCVLILLGQIHCFVPENIRFALQNTLGEKWAS